MNRKELALSLNEKFSKKHPIEILKYLGENYAVKTGFSTSLGAEDQVLTQMIVKYASLIRIFTLDTGRMFPETYELIEETNNTYNINIEIFFPDSAEVETMVKDKGINLFYKSVENRKSCCRIRKTQPMKRALQNVDFWISGIRKDQSVTRFFNKLVEWDEEYELIKVNPLLEWREKDVWDYIEKNNIPFNKLHDKGFSSIGCQPCTRAIELNEDFRAGRWWWEASENKECGLHNQIQK